MIYLSSKIEFFLSENVVGEINWLNLYPCEIDCKINRMQKWTYVRILLHWLFIMLQLLIPAFTVAWRAPSVASSYISGISFTV